MNPALATLLRLFPRSYRERFGAEIAALAGRDLARARARGRRAAAVCATVTFVDLACAALAERWRPSWRSNPTPEAKERTMRWLSDWTTELSQAARTLRRTPGFTSIAAGTLALALGATAGIFGVVDRVLLAPFPYAEIDRLVHVGASAPGSDFPAEFGVSSEFYLQYRELARSLEEIALYDTYTSTLRTPDRVERIRMASATPSLFATLGARPLVGRLPTEADGETVAVIGHALWQSWFAGDPGVVGRSFEMSGERRTVVAVMPPEFRFPNDGALLWLPEEVRAEGLTPGRFGWELVARAKPGIPPERLASELTEIARRLPERFGGSTDYARLIEKHRAVVRPLEQELVGAVARTLWVLLAAAAIVLLVAAANVANLFLVRAETRQRDFALRRAIGAARVRLVRLQLSEALLVALVAGALAIGLAALLLPAIAAAAPAGVPRLDEIGLGFGTLVFTLVGALVAAVVCAAAPALRAARPDLARLREGGRGGTGRRRWARTALVAGQTALALVLLVGSGLLVRSYVELSSVDPGYETADRFTFQFAPEQPRLTSAAVWARFHHDFLDRLAALPGVESVGLVENVPLNESTGQGRFRAEDSSGGEEDGALLHFTFTAGDYFQTMGIALVEGRLLTADDQLGGRGNALVSRSAARALWPGGESLGRRLRSASGKVEATVVGVVEDVRQDSFRDAPEPVIYLPLAGATPEDWRISSPAYVLKTARAETIAPEVRALVAEVAPEAPMYRTFTMERLVRNSKLDLSFTMLTLCLAAALALVLGAVGLYGVLSYLVAERRREIGVRMALGAAAREVRRMVVADGARVVGLGLVVGLAAAFASTRALAALLYGVDPFDPATFAVTAATLVAVGLAASYLPARRASKVDPVVSLRSE